MPPSKQIISRPRDDGFYLPAEWCRHARTWMAWPRANEGAQTLGDDFKQAVASVISMVREFEPVTVIASANDREDIETKCGRNVDVMFVDHDSVRIRDFGPTFLVDGKGGSAAVDWKFDGWSGEAETWAFDAKATHSLLGEAEIRRFRAPLTLEGTTFCCDGEGSLIALADTPLDPNRNPGITKLDAFDILGQWLGVKRVIWLEHGLGKDLGNSEVRRLCSFVTPGHVLVGQQREGAWSALLNSVADRLAKTEDAQGNRITVTRVPLLERKGQICAYTTFYLLNTAVLVPRFGESEDDEAAAIIGGAFPGREIRQVDAEPLLAGGVSLSAIVQYQPARLLERSKATLLPKSAWHRPVPDYVGLLDEYIEKVESKDK